MKRIKILLITTTGLDKKEGISTVLLDYFSRFDHNRFDIDIVASNTSDSELLRELEDAHIKAQMLPKRKKNIKQYVLALKRLFKEKKYDALYIHGSSAIMSIELMIAKMSGCRVRIVHSHNTICDHKNIDKLLRPLFYNLYTDAFACGTEAGKWLYGNHPFTIISNGRDIQKYQFDIRTRQRIRSDMGVSDNDLLIGHVGNFNAQKNQPFLVNIFKEVLKIKSDAKLYLMGSGGTLDSVKRLSEELGISEKIIFTGSISNVPDMLQAMDVMVLPSLHEGLPLVVVEWQMAGVPCLVSDKVTKECAYTNFVKYKSLSDSYQSWANEIIHLSECNRRHNSDLAIKLASENGFDLSQNAVKLEQFFIKQCSDSKNLKMN